jgi:hypothetical protein
LIGHEVSDALYRDDLDEPIAPRREITILVPDASGELLRIAIPYDEPRT